MTSGSAQFGIEVALDGLERSGTAIFVAARDGRIMYANQPAEVLLRDRDALFALDNRLRTTLPAVTTRLFALIEAAVDSAAASPAGAGGALAIPRVERLPLTVLVAPLRPTPEAPSPSFAAAMLFVRDPERMRPAGAILQDLFGLTPAEANIATALADGRSVDEVAMTFGITRNTARTHVKNILAKTGTRRQGQLIAALLRSVAGLASTRLVTAIAFASSVWMS